MPPITGLFEDVTPMSVVKAGCGACLLVELTPTSGVAHPPVASAVPVTCHHMFIVLSQEDTVGSKFHGDFTTAIHLVSWWRILEDG